MFWACSRYTLTLGGTGYRMLASCAQTTLKLVVTFSIRPGLASRAGDHTRFRFLNHPASLVSFGIETERDTLEEVLLGLGWG